MAAVDSFGREVFFVVAVVFLLPRTALLSQSSEHTRLDAACFSGMTRLGMKPWTDFSGGRHAHCHTSTHFDCVREKVHPCSRGLKLETKQRRLIHLQKQEAKNTIKSGPQYRRTEQYDEVEQQHRVMVILAGVSIKWCETCQPSFWENLAGRHL